MDMTSAILDYTVIVQLKDIYTILLSAIKQNNEAVIEMCEAKINELKAELN